MAKHLTIRIIPPLNMEADVAQLRAWCRRNRVSFNGLLNTTLVALHRVVVDRDYDSLVPSFPLSVEMPRRAAVEGVRSRASRFVDDGLEFITITPPDSSRCHDTT